MTANTLIPPSPSDADYKATAPDSVPELQDHADPFALFGTWLAEAREKEINDPNAMALATADADGLPDVRMVLLKDFDEQGFVFYTNLESYKGRQLAENPQAALCFHWKSLRRQVRVRGQINAVSAAEADAYFASRARDSRIGAWASAQSRPLEDRFALEKSVAAHALKFGIGEVPRPAFWSGFRLTPTRIEFWRDRAFRLHDRLEFHRADAATPWSTTRLYP
ncbi:pyridoxine/pyridoxamine 5'-phosphate oxidase [Candidatus Phycosocius bacilliformis]|uniref:Pyridoxine/pyridoxamine 5'-phosphate oxidase n=1 Tax=Candidatus Phycosocius bacilliformis TaxID=1445552 RepID=A0A2P2ECT3_9PROT|nr:pyridoxamine 5'-phosphate oxidase [Candidatus Phycosocius bacilliformis]GBF58873.1 pyridoxine/pyridoxamine 5'-phosphate oxidase [Candidatus Phycosocius bacilliformis]